MKVTADTPGPLPKEAIDYFKRKKLQPDIDLEDAYAEEHAEAFRVAGVIAEDLLEGLRAAVERALEEGLPFKDFAAGLDDVLQVLGWRGKDGKPPNRLRVVYETNMRVARAAGQWARIQRTAEDRPYLTYLLGPSEHHRPLHETWAGTTLRISDAWWSTHMPPNGFGCKCHVRQLGEAEAKRRGVSTSAPAGAPDAGWENNPGAATRGA